MAKKNRPKKINLKDLGGFVFSTNSEFEPPAFEEGDEESEEFNTFLKNLHIFWTGSEFEDFSKPYKLDITKTTEKENLPTSSTCFNNLHLIVYDSFDTFKEKLEISARNANEGFGFA